MVALTPKVAYINCEIVRRMLSYRWFISKVNIKKETSIFTVGSTNHLNKKKLNNICSKIDDSLKGPHEFF